MPCFVSIQFRPPRHCAIPRAKPLCAILLSTILALLPPNGFKNEKIKTDRLMYGLSTLSTQWSSVYPIQHASTSTHSQNDGRSTVSEIHSINSAFIRIFYAICPICNKSAPKGARPIVRQCPEHTMRFWSDK